MTVLLHLSDTHFGTEVPQVVQALLALARAEQPDVLVWSGDVTQRACRSQFAAAGRFGAALGIPRKLVLPGNHDIPLFNLAARLLAPYANYRRVFGPDLEPVVVSADLLLLGVNTTRPYRHKHGEVSDAQVERVVQRLSGAPREQLRVVVTHQPACVVREQDAPDRLRGGEAAVHAWSAAGADLVLGGHIHLPYVSDLCAHALRVPRPMYCLQAGTAVSHRVRPGSPNSVNMVRWLAPQPRQRRMVRVERWDFDLAHARFERTQTQDLSLGE